MEMMVLILSRPVSGCLARKDKDLTIVSFWSLFKIEAVGNVHTHFLPPENLYSVESR